MRHIHMTHCLMGMGLGVALLLAFGVEAGTVAAVGVALLCPLMMVLCMGHVFRHGGSHRAGQAAQTTRPRGGRRDMTASSSRWGGAAGVVAVGAFIAETTLMRHSPSTDQPTSDITAWLTDHRSTALTATYLLGFGATALLFFLEALRRRLRRDDDLDAVANVAFAGGIAVVFMVLLAGGMVAVLAFRPDTTAAVARALYDANGVLVALGAFPAATLVCASSVIALRASVFPRWFAWAGFVISALLLVGAASFQQSGAFKPQGDAGVLQAAIAAFMLWLLAASVVILSTTPSTEAVRPANQSAGIAAA